MSSRTVLTVVPLISAIRAKSSPRSLMEAAARPASARWRQRRVSASALSLASRAASQSSTRSSPSSEVSIRLRSRTLACARSNSRSCSVRASVSAARRASLTALLYLTDSNLELCVPNSSHARLPPLHYCSRSHGLLVMPAMPDIVISKSTATQRITHHALRCRVSISPIQGR